MRLIDADEAKKQVNQMQTLKTSEKILLRLALDRTPTYEPPNAPLTLEELREMDGEPVWVESFIRGLTSHWAIVHGKYLSDGRFVEDKQRCLLSIDENGGHGLAFLAYRRRPEEGTMC